MIFRGVLPLFGFERILRKADCGYCVVRVEVQGTAAAVVIAAAVIFAAANVCGTMIIQKFIQFVIYITHIVFPLFCSAVLSLKHTFIIKQTLCNFYEILVMFHTYYRFLVVIVVII